MTQDQTNVTTMHVIVVDYLGQNKSLWQGVKAISDTVAEVKANNDIIAQKANQQETTTDGVAAVKMQARRDLEDKILEIADQLFSVADKRKDLTLRAQVQLSLSALDGLDDETLEARGKNILDLATANLAALADHNITPADVTALDGLVKQWGTMKSAPRVAIAMRSGQTKTLPQAISDNTSLLRNQLDKQMTKFKRTNPEFYAGYHAARVIVHRRSHHAAKQPLQPVPSPTPPPQ